jgi:Mg2+/Co2+ transporter CorC
MLTLLFGLLLAGILFLCISLQKTYHHVPVNELKRQANAGDEISKTFYRVAAYDLSLDLFLWILIGLSAGGFFVFMSKNFPWPLALFGCIACIWFGFAWLPGSHISGPGVFVAKIFARPLATILEWLHTPLSKTANHISRFRPVTVHTGLYTKQDVLDFVSQQRAQIDNRVSKHELDRVTHTLLAGDKTVGEIMTPWRSTKLITTHDMVGPILMDELHKTGHTHFPVYEGSDKKNIVGILDIADMLDAKEGGFVKDLMSKRIYYLHEEDKITDVFSALAETKQALFIVVSTKEELVGVLSITEVLQQMLGHVPESDFGHHGNREAVAKKRAPKVQHIDETIELEAEIESAPDIEPEPKPQPEVDAEEEVVPTEPAENPEKTETEDEK